MNIMGMSIKQISSLHKVRKKDRADYPAIMRTLALPGESFSYQVYIRGNDPRFAYISVDSPLREHVRVYRVVDAVMDTPVVVETPQEDYITHEPGLMPDMLIPADNQGVYLDKEPCVFWVRVDVPADVKPGDYQINIRLSFGGRVTQTRYPHSIKLIQLSICLHYRFFCNQSC